MIFGIWLYTLKLYKPKKRNLIISMNKAIWHCFYKVYITNKSLFKTKLYILI